MANLASAPKPTTTPLGPLAFDEHWRRLKRRFTPMDVLMLALVLAAAVLAAGHGYSWLALSQTPIVL
jgi:hypothetical protein